MSSYVFEDKNTLVKYLYSKLSNPTQIKVQKTLYLLYAFYGATYGKISLHAENTDFSGQEYPRELFKANFEAWRYGPVDADVYRDEKCGVFDGIDENSMDFKTTLSTNEQVNVNSFCDSIIEQTDVINDFGLVDRTHQDDCWSNNYEEGKKHIKMDNKEIVEEYGKKYVA